LGIVVCDFFNDMSRKLWTKEAVILDAQRFSSVAEWRQESPSAYVVSCRKKWNEEACSHMSRHKQSNGYWTDARIQEESKKYQSTAEWNLASPSSYTAAKKRKLVPASMPRALVRNKWTKTAIADAAIKYATRGEFRSSEPSAYTIALQKGWLDDVCGHMLNVAPWFGPRVIREFLYSHEIEFKSEYKFTEHPTVQAYPFDFYLPKYDLLVEYQGRQHRDGWRNDSQDAKEIQARDKTKRDFARARGINYLEISEVTRETVIRVLWHEIHRIAQMKNIQKLGNSRPLTKLELKEIETRFKWSHESAAEAIGLCSSIREVREKCPSAYDYALKHGLWTDLSRGLERITHHGKYTKQYVAEAASKCSTRNDFKLANRGAWAAAQRNGWLEEVCGHMPKHMQRLGLVKNSS
jgi:very-short-patch-repair endonuclease